MIWHRTLQTIYCRNCGKQYETTFSQNYPNGSLACSKTCYDEVKKKEIDVMFPAKSEQV